MKQAWLAARSAILWAISGVHFAIIGTFLISLGIFIDPRKNDWPQRVFFRNVLRFTGVRFEVRRASGFDPNRISIFICNHVNIFDPFVVYSAIPQFVRGFELESHFKVPIYGWMMGRFGNVPVPDARSREGLERMTRKAKEALDSGVSLVAFAEGSRTRDGHVKRFHRGVFRLAQKFGMPIVPMSIVGSYQFFQTGNWILYPGKITVYLHDTIDIGQIERVGVDELAERVRNIVAAPVEESLKSVYTTNQASRSAQSES
ncbi:MAG TPA: lysophospholipid acyltransferase family protein [Candidatus Acidoferrales bacterium]